MGNQREDKSTLGLGTGNNKDAPIQVLKAEGALLHSGLSIVVKVNRDTFVQDFDEIFNLSPAKVMEEFLKLKGFGGGSPLHIMFKYYKGAIADIAAGEAALAAQKIDAATSEVSKIGAVTEGFLPGDAVQLMGEDRAVRIKVIALCFLHAVHSDMADGNSAISGVGWPALDEQFKANSADLRQQVILKAQQVGLDYLAEAYHFS